MAGTTVIVPKVAGYVAYDPTGVAITGGTSLWSDGSAANPSIAFASGTNYGFRWAAGIGFIAVCGGADQMAFGTNLISLGSGGVFGWSSTAAPGNTVDTGLSRGAAGIVKFTAAGSFSANAAVATVLGSVGPTGAQTTVQKWLTIKDDGGTTRYIPCF